MGGTRSLDYSSFDVLLGHMGDAQKGASSKNF